MSARKAPIDAAELRRLAEATLAKEKSGRGKAPDEARLVHELQVHQIELEMQNQTLQDSRAEVEAGLERYADLYDFAPVAYFSLESDGTICQLNLCAAQLLGTECARLEGRRFGMFVAEASRRDFQRFLKETFESNAKQTCDVMLAIEGRPPLATNITATLSHDGRECRAVVLDLTVRNRAEDALAARDQAEHAMMMRDEFLSIVGHDLGNPLAAIGLWGRYLLDGAPVGAEGAMVRKGASNILAAVSQMVLLREDLSDVVSIDAGCLRMQKQERDARAIVTDTLAAFAAHCREKGLSIVGKALPLTFSCDPHRVQQVLGNLVANAIKFTPKGGSIVVEAVPSGDEVRFSVADTGPGISDEALKHVFERYWRGRERDFTEGVGLGLFIAKGIVEAHGGRIWVVSGAGAGSTFFFTLPLGSS